MRIIRPFAALALAASSASTLPAAEPPPASLMNLPLLYSEDFKSDKADAWHTARVVRTVSTGLIEVYFDDIRL